MLTCQFGAHDSNFIPSIQLFVAMVTSGLLVVQCQPRDEWSCAIMRPGVPSVMDSGQPMMQTWPAGSLDMQTVVCM